MVRVGPSRASGGAITLTRLPSGGARRRSDFIVNAPADLADDALADIHQLDIVGEADIGGLDFALDLDIGRLPAVHHYVGDFVTGEQRLERAVAEDVVADVLEQLLLLGDRHHHVLDGDDFADNIADLFSRGLGIELGELCQVDGVDQRVEDRGLDVVILLRARPLDGLALRLGGRLADAAGSGLGLLFWTPASGGAETRGCGAGAGGATGAALKMPWTYSVFRTWCYARSWSA